MKDVRSVRVCLLKGSMSQKTMLNMFDVLDDGKERADDAPVRVLAIGTVQHVHTSTEVKEFEVHISGKDPLHALLVHQEHTEPKVTVTSIDGCPLEFPLPNVEPLLGSQNGSRVFDHAWFMPTLNPPVTDAVVNDDDVEDAGAQGQHKKTRKKNCPPRPPAAAHRGLSAGGRSDTFWVGTDARRHSHRPRIAVEPQGI